jgi:DNA-binding NarL/FixJ family response regulator
MTRVIVVDDHPVVREGLVAALGSRVEVVAAFGSAEEAIAGRERADVVVLDLELPGMSGLEAIGILRERGAILVLTAYGTQEDIERALAAGAKGYLLKGAPLDEIERGIAAVAAGETYLDPRVSARLIQRRLRLSDREREVLRLVAAGQSNKQIAAHLAISERTAKFHVTSVLNKLGAENRAQAVALAAEQRLI